jgi:glycosyltransferase involved in cell wall biosynthesis
VTTSPTRPVRILLASVLKPVDDTRMFEKFGRTLAEAGYEVHIAGRASQQTPASSGITQHPIFSAHRLALDRLKAQVRYWRLLMHPQHRPDLVIVHAPELLPLTLFWHQLSPQQRPFLYDIRENYALNIETQQVYRGALKRLLAKAVRYVEGRATRRASALLLAERSYADELSFLPAGRTVVLENKYVPPPNATAVALPQTGVTLPSLQEPLRLLFSGTISELNGVFDAIAFAQHLRSYWSGVQLTIVGYCQQAEVQKRIDALVKEHSGWLRLVGGARPVPHTTIIEEIGHSHVGLLPYQPHPSTWRCIPTKLYEYCANSLPVLVPPNALWAAEIQQYAAGLVVDFAQPAQAAKAALGLASGRYYPQGPPPAALWQTEVPRLLAVVAETCQKLPIEVAR